MSDNVLIAEKNVVNCPIKSSSFADLKSGGTDVGNFGALILPTIVFLNAFPFTIFLMLSVCNTVSNGSPPFLSTFVAASSAGDGRLRPEI